MPGVTQRAVVLTSMFCLVSIDQKVLAAPDQGGRHQLRNMQFDTRQTLRQERVQIRDAERGQKVQIRHDREVVRNTSWRHNDSTQANGIQKHSRVSNSILADFVQNPPDQSPKFSGTISDTGRTVKRIDLDLTSPSSKIILGSKLFNDSDGVTIDVGGEQQTFHAGSQVTAGQFVAIKQVLENGSQSLILDKSGAAAGGSFSINSVAGSKVNELVVAAGVTGFDDFATDRRIGVNGDFTNYGSIVATSSNDKITTGVIFGKNINNESGGSIAAGVSQGANADLDLTLSASDRIKNSGAINSSGTLTLESGSGIITNTGTMSSARGDINIGSSDPARTIDIQAEGGRFEALAGNINIRHNDYAGDADVRLRGGDYLSKALNIYSGSGNIDGVVGEVSGQLNTVAGVEHFYAETDLLKVGNNCITGDPTFANSAGGIQIQGLNTFGESVAFLASGDITADSTAKIVANGFNVSMVAGAKITVSAGPETSTVPGAQIGAGTTATVDFSAGNGGSIDLTGSSAATIIDTSSSTGDAGKVVLAALANGTTGGYIKLSSSSLIDTSSSFNGGSGGSISAFAGASPASSAVTLQLGSINSNAGAGAGSAGDVSLNTAQPTGTGGPSVTFDSLGQISNGGPIAAGAAATNGQIQVDNITAKSNSAGGTVSVVASDSITSGSIDATGPIALSGSSVTPTAITSASDITILTSRLHNDGAITSTKSAGSIIVQSLAGLTLEGSGSFSLTGGGAGQILFDANGDNALALTSSMAFNPGSTGSLTFTSEAENGSITIAPAITLTVNDGATINIGTPFLNFLGDGATLNATMASAIKITSGGLPFPLMIATPDNGSVTISTTGGSIDISPTDGSDLIFANMTALNESTLNLMGGPVTTNTVAATTFVSSAMHLNSDNNLAMSSGGAGGIIGLGFQPYVGGFVNGNATTQFDGYSLDTVKALMQQLKNDGYTDVATYSQGSFYFGGQFFGPTSPTAGSNKFNIQAAAAVGLGISAGVFQQGVNGDGFNVADTTQEIAYILQQAQLYPGTVKEIIICNESIFGPNSLNQLNQLIASAIAMRNSTPVTPGSGTMFTSATLPITTRQRWDVIAGVNNNANPLQGALKTLLTSVEGHVYANMYAYFDGGLPESYPTAPSDQGAFTTAVTNSMSGTLGALKTAFQAQGITTQVRIGETGWPTQGLRAPPLSTAPALGNLTLANWYFQAMKTWSASNSVPTVIFQAYDQPWQTVPAAQVPTTPGSSEGFFGLYTANGTSTQTTFTLTSITNKFASGFSIASVGTGARMLSNSGTITASNVVIDTPHLDNNGNISSMSAAGSVSVSTNTDLDVTGTGSITRTGGGAGSVSFTTIGANDLEVRGVQTINAGAGNSVTFNAMDDGASFTLAQGAVINLPTNDTKLAINSEHFLRNGNIDTHSVTNPNTTVTVNATGDSTIACSVGALDISGMDINVSTGHLALLSAGDIINSGAALSLDLNSGAQGGSLIMMAGFSFNEIVLGTADPFYVLDSTSNTTGNVIFNAAGHEVNINTSGTNGGGKVDVYANGSVALNNITTGGGSGTSGNVIIAGAGVVTGNIDTTATSLSSSGAVDIRSGTVVHDGVQVLCGSINSGNFSVGTLGGNIAVGSINAGLSNVLVQTDGASSAISFNTATLPAAHNLSLLAGTGTLNLPTSNISVAQDAAGNGGALSLSASNFAGVSAPLVLNAEGTGTGAGGSVSYANTSTADLSIDQSVLQLLASGVDGGSVSIAAGGNLFLDPVGTIDAAPTGINGKGTSFDFSAGTVQAGALVISGSIDSSANGTGTAGDVRLSSNSSRSFTISSGKAKNGIQGQLLMNGNNPGSLTVINNGGGIDISQPLTFVFQNLILDTSKTTKGTISLRDAVSANGSIDVSVGGNGRLSSGMLSAPSIAISGGTRMITATVNTQTLTANSDDSIRIFNESANALVIGTSIIGRSFSLSSQGTISTSGDITAGESVSLNTTTGDINIGGNIIANSTKKGSVFLEISDTGNFADSIPLGTDAIKAKSVEFRGTDSNIGSGTAIAGAVRVDTGEVIAGSAGLANINSVGTGLLELRKASTAGSFTLRSAGSVSVSSGLTSATAVDLDTTAGAGDIAIRKGLGDSATTQTIILASNTGSISAKKSLSAATSITLQSAGGNIGTADAAIATNAPSIQATTSGTGTVVLSTGSAPTTLLDSSSGGDFIVNADGDMSINDIAVGNGAIFVAARGALSTVPGATLTANSNGAAGSGSITLQGTRKSSSIFVGAGSTIATSGVGGGDVSIFIGTNPPPQTNPLSAGTNGNFFVTTSGGGQVYADLATIVGNAPVNALNALGKNVLINGGANSAVTIDGNVTITADPPIATASLSSQGTIPETTAGGLTFSSAQKNVITPADSSSTSNQLNKSAFDLNSLNFDPMQSIASNQLSQSQIPLGQVLSSSEKSADFSSAVLNSQSIRSTTLTQTLGTRTKQSVPEHSQLIGADDCVSGEVDAVHLTREAHSSALRSGSFLCTPAQDTTLETSLGKVKIDKGSMVLVMVRDRSLAVFNLHDTHKNAVQVTIGDTSQSLSPGRQAVLTKSKSDQFQLVNPAEAFQYRNLKRKVLADGVQMFSSEFCIATALQAIKPTKQMLISKDKITRRLTNNVLKTTAIIAALNRSTTPFEEMPHPKLTVCQK